MAARLWGAVVGPQRPQNGRETGPPEIGHANGPQTRLRVFMDRIDGSDVGVLQLRQRLRLVPLDCGHLEHYGPIREPGLLREEDAGEGAPTELLA